MFCWTSAADGAGLLPGVRTCVIFNPTARGERATRFRQWIEARQRPDCVFEPTPGPGTARSLAAAAARRGVDTLVAAGGDGTVNEVVNGLLEVPDAAGAVRFGVLPLGTMNVLAVEAGIPFSVDAAWEVVQAGEERPIWTAGLRAGEGPGAGVRHFLCMAGAGFDAAAVEGVSWELKKRWGGAAYLVAAGRAWARGLPRFEVTATPCEAGTRPWVANVCLAVAGNTRHYGGRWLLCRDACPFTGRLELATLRRVGVFTVLGCCLAGLSRRLDRVPGLERHCVDAARLAAACRVPVQLDGDAVGTLPVEIRARAARIRLLTPRTSAG